MDGRTYTIQLSRLTAKGDLASGNTVREIERQLRGQNAPPAVRDKCFRVEATWIQGQKPVKRGYDAIDLDNPVKAAIDTVNASESGWNGERVLWHDDVQIVELVVRREYDADQTDSALHLAIREVPKPWRQKR